MALTKLPKNAITDGSIDSDKIEDGTIQNQEISGTLPEEKLATGIIENASLSNSSITINGNSISLGGSSSVGVDVNWQSVITGAGSSSTAVAGNGYFIDTTSNTHTLNLPASATLGDQIAIKDYAGTFASNNLTIGRNGHNIQGVANDSLISTNRASLLLVYVDATKGWLYTDEHNVGDLQSATYTSATGGTITTSGDFKIHSFTGDGCFVVSSVGNPAGGGSSVDYMVVAGGGGGGGDYGCGSGGASGAGAGGFRESHSTPVSGCYTASPLSTPTGLTISATTYPVTVGGGGTGGCVPAPGTQGSNSVFSTITSAGGGGGSNFNDDALAGGSGGGGVAYFCSPAGTGKSGNTPPVSPPQGNPGGNMGGIPNRGSAGGGGAGVAGTNNPGGNDGTPGGNGVTTSISGSPTAYGGGGGGGSWCSAGAGTGGSGGGGNGGNGGQSGFAGTANTGGGGGGSGPINVAGQPLRPGGAGGKGIVIIRYKFQ